MNRPCLPIFAAALAALLAALTDANAAFVTWTYNWSRLPTDVVAADANGTSRLSLTDEALGNATNSSDIVATNIRTFSNAPRATPNTFLDAAYGLTLRLTDTASGQSGALTFSGVFNGTLSAASSDISTTLSNASQELTLGGNRYAVTLEDYSPPGPPGINNAGSIGAHVEVTPAEGPPPVEPPPVEPPPAPTDTPEPSTMLLAGLGLSALGMASWRRRRAASGR